MTKIFCDFCKREITGCRVKLRIQEDGAGFTVSTERVNVDLCLACSDHLAELVCAGHPETPTT